MTLQLDGGNTIIGTEFIKLEITGTSNLATQNTMSINKYQQQVSQVVQLI